MAEMIWAVAQTVSKMEHLVRRDIERANHGAFLPTYAKRWKVDDRDYVKEFPLLTGYVFFMTDAEEWAGVPDIHGVYRVPANPNGKAQRVLTDEMHRLMFGHIVGAHDLDGGSRYTRYYRPPVGITRKTRRRARPRRSRQFRENPVRNQHDMQINSRHGMEQPKR